MNRKKTRLGDTRYIFENYSEFAQLRNEFIYTQIRWMKIDNEMKEIMAKLVEFKPKVKIEPE